MLVCLYDVIKCDVININREFLRYFFWILATLLEVQPIFKVWRKDVEWFIYKEYVLCKYFVFKFKNMAKFE